MRNHLVQFGFSVFIAILFLAVATKSSPLYPFNDWVDANAIFTVGKSMMKDKVLYRDIFEQKGPLLYFIHGIGSLISERTFFGIYLMEVLSFTFFLVYCHKILVFYVNKKLGFLGIAILAFLVLYLTNFTHGDSAEEYCLPLLAASMFYILDYFKNGYPNKIPVNILLINGLLAGCVLWIKYSMLGYWFGWMFCVFFATILIKEYWFALKACLVFLLGMVLSGIPWFLYFFYHGAISDFIEVYFVTNLKYYASSGNLFENLVVASGKIIIVDFIDNPIFALFLVSGLVSLLFFRIVEQKWLIKLVIFIPFIFLFLSVYGGGVRHVYYFQILTPFVIFGIIFFLKQFRSNFEEIHFRKRFNWVVLSLVTFLFVLMFTTHHNSYLMKKNKEDLFQFKFAKRINSKSNPTLLNYGFLDAGVHTAADVEPSVRYFMRHNFQYSIYPFDVDEQNRYVKTQLTDFVVARNDWFYDGQKEFLNTYYTIVMEEEQFYEGEIYKYFLYEVK